MSNSTINDVARISGVSKRTVSRVLNNSPKVNPETREKIQKIIQDLDYTPSKQARGLASNRSYLLGLLYDDPNVATIHSVQKGILSACSGYGYELVVHPVNYQSDELVPQVLKFVSRSQLDGLVIIPPISTNEDLIQALQKNHVEYVRVASKMLDVMEKMVVSEDRKAMVQVADLFHRESRNTVGIILGPPHRLASAERYEGLKSALKTHGLKIKREHAVLGDNSYESGLRCGHKLLSGKSIPNAVFASNDQMAIGLIHAADDLGIKIPQQLMVVGYDDEPMATRLRPSLSTLKRPLEEMAHDAALKLIALITNNAEILNKIPTAFTPQLICRETTGDGKRKKS